MNVDTGLGSLVDAVNNLRKFAEESDNQERIDIKINGEKKLRELNEQLEKLDKAYQVNINVNIPDIERKMEDLRKQIDSLNEQQANASKKLLYDIGSAANKYFDSVAKSDGKYLLDLIHTFEQLSGKKFTMDIVPNIKNKDYINNSFVDDTRGVLVDYKPKLIQQSQDGTIYNYSKDISKQQLELDKLQKQLDGFNKQINEYNAQRLDLLNKIKNAEEELGRIEEEISKKEQERIQRENENQRQESDQSWKNRRQKRNMDDYEDDFQSSDEKIDFDDAKYSDDIADLSKIYDILKKIYDVFERINKSIGSIDDDSGLKNVLSQLDDIFKRLADIQEKAGNGIFNVQLGAASDQSKIIDEKMGAKWTETYQRYIKVYDKIFKSITDAYRSPDTLFAKIYSMNPDQQDMDSLKNMFSRNAILSLQDPKEQVRRLTEFFKYVQQIVDTVDEGADETSKAVAAVMNKADNRVQTNFKAIESRVNKIRSDAMPDDEALEDSLKNSIQEMMEADAKAEDWQHNLLEILNTLNKIKEAFEELANKDLFNTASLDSLKTTLEQISQSLNTQNIQTINTENITSAISESTQSAEIASSNEINGFDRLRNSIEHVVEAIKEKTNAFTQEKIAVETAVQYEISQLDLLISKLEEVKTGSRIDLLFETQNDTGLSSLDNVVNNISNSVDKKNEKFKQEDDIVSEVVNSEVLKLAELQTALEEVQQAIRNKTQEFDIERNLMVSSIDIEIQKLQELKAEFDLLQNQNLNTDQSANKNINDLSNLESSLLNIINLITEKTEAFNKEGQVVDSVIQSEYDKLMMLAESLRIITESISKIKLPDNQTPEWIKDLNQFDTDKIQAVSTSLSDMYDAISKLDISDSNLLTSINQILSKGKELQNLVKVLSASKKDINRTQQKVTADQDRESKASYARELEYYKKAYALIHKINVAKAKGEDESVLRDRYQAEIDLYKTLIQQENERRRQQNLTNAEQDNHLAREIVLIEKKNKAEIEGLQKTTEARKKQEFKNTNIAEADSQIKDLERVRGQLEDLLKQKAKNLMPQYVQEANDQIKKLNDQIQLLEDAKVDIINSQDLSTLKKATNLTQEIISDTKKVKADATDSANKLAKDIKIKNLDEEITDFLTKNTKLSAEFRAELDALRKKLSGDNLSNQDILDIASAFAVVKTRAKEAGDVGKSQLDSLKQRLSDMNTKFLARFFSLQDVIRYGRTIVSTIQDLDYSLVDLRKTTTMSASELNEFYYSANDVAVRLGQTTKEIINQAAAWSRLGYSSKEAATQMAELSSQFAAISPGMSLDDATDGLVSTMKGFGIAVEDTERTILDNVNRIGNTFATSNSEIMEMLKRSSAAMNEANNTLEQTIALESAAVQVTRNAETTGTAFRTEFVLVYSNMHYVYI